MLGVDWTTEQTARVLHILEPEKVDLNSQQSSRYEALFQPKTVASSNFWLLFSSENFRNP